MNNLDKLRQLPISDLYAMRKHLQKDIRFWKKEIKCARTVSEIENLKDQKAMVQFFLEWVNEILNEKVYSFKIEDTFNA